MKSKTSSDYRFVTIAVTHHKTPIEIREKFSFSNEAIAELTKAALANGTESLFVVSTCNRCQFFAFTSNVPFLNQLFIKHTAASEAEFSKYAYCKIGDEAIEHLFEVTSGLDSQLLGDIQISYQVKEGFNIANDLGAIDKKMDRLFQFALQAYKAIRTDTHISDGAASAAHAAVLYAKQCLGNLTSKNILLFGLGEIGESTCKNLIDNGISNLTLINRTLVKAEELAFKHDVKVLPIEELSNAAKSADIIIVSTGADTPTLAAKHFEGADDRTRLLLDLSVPRNISSDVEKLSGVQLIDMDRLSALQDETLERRKKSLPKAKTIINLHIMEFDYWLEMQRIVPAIKGIKDKMHDIRNKELAGIVNKISKEEFELVDRISKSIVNKIATHHIEHLKSNFKYSQKILDVVEDLFELNQQNK